jgi:hypothetical protein
MVLLVLAGLVFLVVLFVAPIKLYSIHREIQRTNDLLRLQADLLAKIEDRERVQVGLLATIANMSQAARERISSGSNL